MSDPTHDEVLGQLSPWLDDELDPVASAAIGDHLAGCEACAREAARLRALGATLRSGLEAQVAPPRLRARVAPAIAPPAPAAPGRRPARWAWRFAALAAAALVVAGAWLAVLRVRGAEEDRLALEVVSSHVRSLMAAHLTDVASTDQHTVKPWFDGRLDFAPPVADLADLGFPLLGGRLDYVNGRPVAALVYGRRRHVINLLVWPRTGAVPTRSLTRRGYHAFHGVAGGVEYWAVSDLSPPEMAVFVRSLLARGL